MQDRIVFQISEDAGIIRYAAHWERAKQPPIEYWIAGPDLAPEGPAVWDGMLYAIHQQVLAEGGSVRVEGAVSAQCVKNMAELRELWQICLPQQYPGCDWEFATIQPDRPTTQTGLLCAFSGGADALFTLLRHKEKSRGAASYNIQGALLVHGFDVPLAQADSFCTLERQCRYFLDTFEVPLHILRTNLREALPLDWEMTHGGMLAGCLHAYANRYAGAMLGSSYSYNHFRFPWGSSPALDHLYASSHFGLVHDGAGFTRFQKLGFLSRFPAALAALKVCCYGDQPEKNCGKCRKCFRTRLCLRAFGVERCEAFPEPLLPGEIASYWPRLPGELELLESTYQECLQMGAQGEWMRAYASMLERTRRWERTKEIGRILAGGQRSGLWRKIQQWRHGGGD